MSFSQSLIEMLKKWLKARGVNYKTLADQLKMSEAGIKYMFSKGTISLKRLEEICLATDIDFVSLVNMVQQNEVEKITVFTEEQEIILASSPELLSVAYLVHSGWQYEQILETYEIDAHRLTQICVELDNLQIIEFLPGNKIKDLTGDELRWKYQGPIQQAFEQQAISEFLSTQFEGNSREYHFDLLQVSTTNLERIQKIIKKAHREIIDMGKIDHTLPPKGKQNIGLLLAYRPWAFSGVNAIPRKKE